MFILDGSAVYALCLKSTLSRVHLRCLSIVHTFPQIATFRSIPNNLISLIDVFWDQTNESSSFLPFWIAHQGSLRPCPQLDNPSWPRIFPPASSIGILSLITPWLKIMFFGGLTVVPYERREREIYPFVARVHKSSYLAVNSYIYYCKYLDYSNSTAFSVCCRRYLLPCKICMDI